MEECQVYRFNHKALFWRMSCLISLLLGTFCALAVVAIVVKGLVRGSGAVDGLRRHPQPITARSALYVVPILCVKLTSLAMVPFRVTLSDTEISGRSGMGRKRTLPLEDLKEIIYFGSNGLYGCHLISRSHGYTFTPLDLENVEQLLTALEPHVPAEPGDPSSCLHPDRDSWTIRNRQAPRAECCRYVIRGRCANDERTRIFTGIERAVHLLRDARPAGFDVSGRSYYLDGTASLALAFSGSLTSLPSNFRCSSS
jgi:hypothetical protein